MQTTRGIYEYEYIVPVRVLRSYSYSCTVSSTVQVLYPARRLVPPVRLYCTVLVCRQAYRTVRIELPSTSTSTVRRRNPSRGIPELVRVLYAYEYCTVVCRQAYRTAILRIELPRILYVCTSTITFVFRRIPT